MRLLLYLKICFLFMVSAAVAQVPVNEKNDTLKQTYLKSLKDVNPDIPENIPSVGYAPTLNALIFSIIVDELHTDPDIRAALIRIEDNHPISWARAAAQYALSDNPQRRIIVSKNKVNQTRHYCLADSVSAEPLAALPLDIQEKLSPAREDRISLSEKTGEVTEPVYTLEGVNISAQSVSGGWLTGYGPKSENGSLPMTHIGLGLHFIPNDSTLPTELLLDGTFHAIIPKSGEKNAFFVIATTPHFSFDEPPRRPGPLVVYLLKETALAKFEINEFRKLPTGLKQVAKMENDDLFLSFGGPEPTFYWQVTKPFYDNPPIGFTPNGKIYAICEENTVQF